MPPKAAAAGTAKDYDVLKLMLLGDSSVGKTSLLLKYVDDKFNPTQISTIGVDMRQKYVEINGRKVKLTIWDTAGQERYLSVATQYLRGAKGIAMVYDVTNEESFQNVQKWAAQIQASCPEGSERILLGNKADLEDKRMVDAAKGQALAAEYHIPFFETSAKSGDNLDAAFLKLAENALKNSAKDAAPAEGAFKVGPEATRKQDKKGCCAAS